MKREIFGRMYRKCVPDKSVTRRLIETIEAEDAAEYGKMRLSTDEDDVDEHLHIEIAPKKKKISLSPILPAAAAMICIIGAAVYAVGSGEDISVDIPSADGVYESTDCIDDSTAADVSVENITYAGDGAAGSMSSAADAVYTAASSKPDKSGESRGSETEEKPIAAVLETSVPKSTEITETETAAELPASDKTVLTLSETQTLPLEEKAPEKFGDLLERYGRDDSGMGIKMSYKNGYVLSPDDYLEAVSNDAEEIFRLLWEYADAEQCSLPVSDVPEPAVTLEITYFDALKYPEADTAIDGVMEICVFDIIGFSVTIVNSSEYYSFGCDSQELFEKLYKIILNTSWHAMYSQPQISADSINTFGDALNYIESTVHGQAIVSRKADGFEDISGVGTFAGVKMGTFGMFKLLRSVSEALPCEKSEDVSQKITIGLHKNAAVEIYPDSVTFILDDNEYSFGQIPQEDLWIPVNDYLSRLNVTKQELARMTEKEITERLMGLSIYDLNYFLSPDSYASERLAYVYFCDFAWVVEVSSDSLGGYDFPITEVKVVKWSEAELTAEQR